MPLFNTIIMDIRETYEYRLVKQLTKKENKAAIKRTIIQGTILFFIGVVALHTFLNAFLWLLKL